MRNIRMVDGREADWENEAKEVAETGQNFLIILGNSEKDLSKLCRILGCTDKERPERLGRWGIHALNDVLQPADYEKLLAIEKSGQSIYFVEQLHLSTNRPPRIKKYMVYCEVRGIVSHHDSVEAAKSSYFEYLESFRRAKMFLMVGIYCWEQQQWIRLRSVF